MFTTYVRNDLGLRQEAGCSIQTEQPLGSTNGIYETGVFHLSNWHLRNQAMDLWPVQFG